MPAVSLKTARAPLTLALDAGTSSVRALAFDRDGNPILDSEVQSPYSIDTTIDGGATFAASTLFDLTVATIDGIVARLDSRASDVRAVGTTSFWHSLLGLDRNGQPTTPILYWADTRSGDAAAALRDALNPEAIWQRTGCRLHPSYWPAKLQWLRVSDPVAFEHTARWLSFPEYALDRLCGPRAGAVTICMASGTGLLDVHNNTWDEEILHASGVSRDQLSPLVDLGPPGKLRETYAARWPGLHDAAWFPALGDGACANVGSGAIGPECCALTIGTSAAMRLILPRPSGSEWSVPHGLWAYRLDSERAVLGGALSNGGNLLRWIWETTGTAPDDAATTAAAKLSADSTGLTVLPFLAGERSPGWYDDASGVFAGLTLSTRPEHLIRAGWESVAYRLSVIYDALSPLAETPHQIVASGGAILSMAPWLQITADVLGHDLAALEPADETTARGAALMAMAASGIIRSLADAERNKAYEASYRSSPAAHAVYRDGRARQARLESILVQAGAFV